MADSECGGDVLPNASEARICARHVNKRRHPAPGLDQKAVRTLHTKLILLPLWFLLFALAASAQQRPGDKDAKAVTTASSDGLPERWEQMAFSSEYEKLLGETTQAIQRDPEMAIAFHFRAFAYRGLDKNDLGNKDAEEVLRLLTNPRTAIEYKARCHSKGILSKPAEEVIKDCTSAIELDPKLASAYIVRALAYRGKKDYDRAVADYSKVISLRPNDAYSYGRRAFTYRLMGRSKLALPDINKAIELEPSEADYYHTRGLINGENGQSDRAITDYSKAIDLYPDFYYAYLNRGTEYAAKEEYDRAIADYTSAIDRRGEKYSDPYSKRAHAYLAKSDIDLAIADFTKAIAIEPKKLDPYLDRGRIYSKRKMFDLALADFTKAIELDPKRDDLHNIRGNVYFKKGMFDLAIADYTRASELAPRYAYLYLRQRANAYEKMGDQAQAKADRQKADEMEREQKKIR